MVQSQHVFLPGNIYENKIFKFSLVYPEGSRFGSANPDLGFQTRFFIPDGKKIGGDTENVGIYVKPYDGTTELWVEKIKNSYSKNGKIDVKDYMIGGIKGYRLIYVSDYTSMPGKNSKEVSYIVANKGNIYEINYFPLVEDHLKDIDNIVNSFKFTE